MGASLTRRELHAQFSAIQMVDASAGIDRVTVDETIAVYQPASGAFRLRSQRGGDMNPSQSVLTRIPLTIDQKDFGKWDWGAEQWPAGIWNVRDTFESQQPLQVMKASLNDRGIELHWGSDTSGKQSSLQKDFEDLLLYWPPANPVILRQQGTGVWSATASDGVDGASWVAGTLLNEQQLMRQKIYAGLLGQPERYPLLTHGPVVLGWSQPLPSPMESQPAVPKSGHALWMLPIRLETPAKGSKLAIPGWMLSVRPSPTSGGESSFFRTTLGKWAGSFSNPASVELRFQLPAEAIPSEVTSVRLRMRLLLPQRTLTISHMQKGVATPLEKLSSPTSQIELELGTPAVRESLTSGSVDLRFEIGSRDATPGQNGPTSGLGNWQIDTMSLDIEGTK